MSRSSQRGRGGQRAGAAASADVDAASGPAPAGAIVAVVERRGRFLTAEPLFPQRERDSAPAGVRAGGATRGGGPPQRGRTPHGRAAAR